MFNRFSKKKHNSTNETSLTNNETKHHKKNGINTHKQHKSANEELRTSNTETSSKQAIETFEEKPHDTKRKDKDREQRTKTHHNQSSTLNDGITTDKEDRTELDKRTKELNKQFETLTLYNLNNNAHSSNLPLFSTPTTLSLSSSLSSSSASLNNNSESVTTFVELGFQYMPTEIKLWIFSFLESTDLSTSSCVCKEWNLLTKERHLWIGKRRGMISRKLKVNSLQQYDKNGNPIDQVNTYRIVLVGAGGVGKSALVVRFVIGKFVEKYDPTIEDGYRVQADIDNEVTNLDIIDTAGPEEYSSLRDQYIKLGNGFIIVYSTTSMHSFQTVPKLYNTIIRLKEPKEGQQIPIILVGNKSDPEKEKERAVPTQEGQQLANKYSHFTRNFWETSAKHNRNVNEIFFEIVRQIDTVNEILRRQTKGEESITPLSHKKKRRSDKQSSCVLQ